MALLVLNSLLLRRFDLHSGNMLLYNLFILKKQLSFSFMEHKKKISIMIRTKL